MDAFDAEDIVWQYRLAHDTKDVAECLRLRQAWKESVGEDSLHEMAWGEPIEPEVLAERKALLIKRLRDTEAQLAWLAVFNPEADGVSSHGTRSQTWDDAEESGIDKSLKAVESPGT